MRARHRDENRSELAHGGNLWHPLMCGGTLVLQFVLSVRAPASCYWFFYYIHNIMAYPIIHPMVFAPACIAAAAGVAIVCQVASRVDSEVRTGLYRALTWPIKSSVRQFRFENIIYHAGIRMQ
jgi:hypothetical protein